MIHKGVSNVGVVAVFAGISAFTLLEFRTATRAFTYQYMVGGISIIGRMTFTQRLAYPVGPVMADYSAFLALSYCAPAALVPSFACLADIRNTDHIFDDFDWEPWDYPTFR